MEVLNTELDFRELHEGENLYDGTRFENRTEVVPAQYARSRKWGNDPDLCALPHVPDREEIIRMCTRDIDYDPDAVARMSKAEKLEEISEMQFVICPLGLHVDLASVISDMLETSYKTRQVVISHGSLDGNDQEYPGSSAIISIRRGGAPRPKGFFLYGRSGCGKTVSVETVLSMFPPGIRHTFTGISYTQIPVVLITALENQVSDLFRSIASYIDMVLDTGDRHERMVSGKKLVSQKGALKTWIKCYHIGLIIIDEIQYLNLSGKKQSIQDIIGITQETGCNFGLIGNLDAAAKMWTEERLLSRVSGNIIQADIISGNQIRSKNDLLFFENALSSLWEYQWTQEYYPLTDDIKSLLYKESAMNIALLKLLITTIQHDAVTARSEPILDVSYISKVADKDFQRLRAILSSDIAESEKNFQEYVTRMYARISASAGVERESDKADVLETLRHNKTIREQAKKIDKVVEVILLSTDHEYTEVQIRRAIQNLSETDNSFALGPVEAMIKTVQTELKKLNGKATSKSKSLETKVVRANKNAEKNAQIVKALGGVEGLRRAK